MIHSFLALSRSRALAVRFLAVLLLITGCQSGDETRLVLAATTSLEDTGLLDTLAAEFASAHPDIRLTPIAVGTGQAIQLARRGDADVLITHDSAAEIALVADGVAKERKSLMHNDFVIAGPADDPAHARGTDALASLRAIAAAGATFVSRGDDSGTHRKELALWRAANTTPRGSWYIEAGLGQGDALLLASQKRAYILTDRATYIRFEPRLGLDVIAERDARLLNTYGVVVLNGKHEEAANTFAGWLTSEDVQRLIGEFGRTTFGESLFIPSDHGAAVHDTIPTGER
jgi:tungstate transport system substrate-binding protein